MTVKAKAIVSAYYDNPLKYSYWNGCSAGGRQAMKEAQKYPADYDGIIAGSPGLDWTGRATAALRIAQVTKDEAARIPAAKAQLIHKAVVEACDAIDGIKDGVLDDPTRCKFDPGVLECKGADDATCLTKAQTQTARLIYMSPVNPKTKREITGLAPGSELGWTDQGGPAVGPIDRPRSIPVPRLQRPDLGRGEVQLRDRHRARGGNRRRHDQRARSEPEVVLRSRRQADSVSRLERSADLAGQQRPVLQARRRRERRRGEGSGVAPPVHGARAWGTAAAARGRTRSTWWPRSSSGSRRSRRRIRSSRRTRATGKVDRTRPLCPYPQVASYKGTGSTDEAANFVCK